MYFALEKSCHLYTATYGVIEADEVKALVSGHEEADTRLIFIANFIGSNCQGITPTVVVRSGDTDVFILLLYHQIHVNANL